MLGTGRGRWVAVALAVLVAASLASPAVGRPETARAARAVPGPRARHRPALAPAPRDGLTRALRRGDIGHAEYAYQRALATFAPSLASDSFGKLADPGVLDGTLVLRDLRLRMGALPPREQHVAQTFFDRPDDGQPPTDPEDPKYTVPAKTACFTHVCVHWVESTRDAVRLTDADSSGRPDWIDTVGTTLENVWTTTITQNGFRAPKSDLSSANHGPDGKFDVYLADIPMYGFVTTDDPHSQQGSTYKYWDMSAYMVLDNDFSPDQFDAPNLTGGLGLRMGASHEFFHAVQYAYDYAEAPFYMEGTAAWNEDIVYDSLNTRYSWFNYTNLQHPEYSIDWNKYIETYGAFLFWRFWSEYWSSVIDGAGQAQPDPGVIKALFQLNDGAQGGQDYQSIQGAYVYAQNQGTVFRDVVSFYHVWNTIPGTPPSGTTNTLYEEGANYPPSPPASAFTITSAAPSTGQVTESIDHLASASIAYTPGSGVTSAAALRLSVDLPPLTNNIDVSHDPQALVVVSRVSGPPEVYEIALNSSGVGSIDAPFQAGSVAKVTLVLTNASVRYDCSIAEYDYFCHPLDQDDPFIVTATLRPTGRVAAGTVPRPVRDLEGVGR